MRLWHKDMISYLPDAQLKGQWRELALIARNIHETGSPGHRLVDPVVDYPLSHLVVYSYAIAQEMRERGWNPDINRILKWFPKEIIETASQLSLRDVFLGWHNDNYYTICYYNLLEKQQRDMIPWQDWMRFMRGTRGRNVTWATA